MYQFYDSTVQKLAGNAFNANCCGALVLATMIGLSKCKERAAIAKSIGGPPNSDIDVNGVPVSGDAEGDAEARRVLLAALDTSTEGEDFE